MRLGSLEGKECVCGHGPCPGGAAGTRTPDQARILPSALAGLPTCPGNGPQQLGGQAPQEHGLWVAAPGPRGAGTQVPVQVRRQRLQQPRAGRDWGVWSRRDPRLPSPSATPTHKEDFASNTARARRLPSPRRRRCRARTHRKVPERGGRHPPRLHPRADRAAWRRDPLGGTPGPPAAAS